MGQIQAFSPQIYDQNPQNRSNRIQIQTKTPWNCLNKGQIQVQNPPIRSKEDPNPPKIGQKWAKSRPSGPRSMIYGQNPQNRP